MDSATSPITIIVNNLRGQNIAFTTLKSSPISSLFTSLASRAPWILNSPTGILLTTNSRKVVSATRNTSAPVSTLLSSPDETFLPLRLTVPMCGGKGGFGSILRAQGGRMSSRKKRQNGEANASSRNLDGRRLRTVTEAKALADYLAAKPELERREKEEKRKRWEDIVASTERKEEEIRGGRANVRLDGKWVESKEESEKATQEAIRRMLAERSSSEEEEKEPVPAASASKPAAAPKAMFGWDDEDDEFMSDSEEDEEVEEEDATPVVEGKGKGKAAI